MNSALSHCLSSAVYHVAPSFKVNGEEVSRRILAALFPVPTIMMPTLEAPTPPAPLEIKHSAMVEVDENVVAVLYNGKEYWVSENSHRVYEETAEGIHEFRGMAGLAEFDRMIVPVDEI